MVMENKGAKIGTKFVLVSCLLLVIVFAYLVMADVTILTKRDTSSAFPFAAYTNSSPIYTSSINTVFNFSIAADASFGINETNFTLTGCPNFMANFSSAGSNAVGNVTNVSTNQLSWKNYTSNAVLGYMIPAGTIKYFWFNITSPNNNGTGCELVVNTTDWRGVTNTTKIAIIVDTILPNITVQSYVPFSNLTTRILSINYSANDTNMNHTVVSAYLRIGAVTLVATDMNSSTQQANQTTRTTLTLTQDGIYNITILASDKAGNINISEVANITVDTTGPNVTVLNAVRGINLTGLVNVTSIYDSTTGIFNLSAVMNDVMSNVTSLSTFFNVTNTTLTGLSTSFKAAFAGSVARLSAFNDSTFNLSKYPDGLYYVTVWANDTFGNRNLSEYYRIAKDTIKPAVAISRASTSNRTAIVVTITTSDGTTGVANCTSSLGTVSGTTSVTYIGLSCGTAHIFNVTCSDYLSNTNSSTSSFSTDSCDSSSGGGGSSSATPNELATGFTKAMYAGEVVSFKALNSPHQFILTNINKNGSVSIQISSVVQKAVLNVGEERKFDLNNDSSFDILVKLNSITGSKADITLKSITEAGTVSPEPEKNVAEQVGEKVTEVIEGAKQGQVSSWMWILWTVLIIALIVVVVVMVVKKQKKRKY